MLRPTTRWVEPFTSGGAAAEACQVNCGTSRGEPSSAASTAPLRAPATASECKPHFGAQLGPRTAARHPR
eukprot:392105-Alexandrium_andersonii.AAC.1